MNTDALRLLWRQRPERERRLIVLAACVLGLAGLWQWALAPALGTWRDAAQRQTELDRQTQQMLQLKAQAAQLKAPARMARAQAVDMLESSAKELLGPDAKLLVQGEQDEYGTMAQLRAIERAAPHAVAHALPDCGHSPHRDQPQALTALLQQFVTKHAF